jgi:hypothetical protein
VTRVLSKCGWGWLAVCLLLVAFGFGLKYSGRGKVASLPYDRSNPVLYDNDEAVDMYTDEYLLAQASLGQIQLKGMTTSSPVEPYDVHVTTANYERCVSDREQLVATAKASSFVNIPGRARGPMGNLQRPASGRIEDTPPIGAPGSWLIVEEATKASPDKPLVIVAGAPLTAEADAYLLHPSIADKVVVAWLGGEVVHPWMGSLSRINMCDYNGWGDPWAAYIVLQKLRLVEFPLNEAPPQVPKTQLLDLPASPLRDYMYKKHHPTNSDPRDIDGDGAPAIGMMRSDYPLVVDRVAFKKWVPCDRHDVPELQPSMEGRAWFVRRSNQRVATEEWWQTMRKALSR